LQNYYIIFLVGT